MSIRAKLFTLSTLALIADTTVAIEPIDQLKRLGAWRAVMPNDQLAAGHLHERLLLRLEDGRDVEVFFSRFEGERAVFRGVDPLTKSVG